jgi:hypothetical protein
LRVLRIKAPSASICISHGSLMVASLAWLNRCFESPVSAALAELPPWLRQG